MVLYFNKRDVINFGKYLGSEERRQRFIKHPDPTGLPLDDRLAIVNRADVDNWLETFK